ncbi:MAG: GGDEF domain-containing response regulator [Phycisphaerae bacterium]
MNLLVVDDDPDHVQLMSLVLRDAFTNLRLKSVGTCEAARQQDFQSFDLALIDLNLPDGNGIDLMRDLRSRCDVPVVLVTGERFGEPAVEGIRGGAADYVVKHGDYLRVLPIVVVKTLALEDIKDENRRLQSELLRHNSELEKLNVTLREMAAHDSLTGLYNRRHFNELFDQLFAESTRYDTDLTCMMMDLDDFKQVNDRLGHPVGDRLLVLTAEALSSALRTSDVVGRYGGDEFVALLPRTSPQEAKKTAKRLRAIFRDELLKRMPDVCQSTLSIGLASREQQQPHTSDTLLRLADEALYQAKSSGKNRIVIVRPMAVDA